MPKDTFYLSLMQTLLHEGPVGGIQHVKGGMLQQGQGHAASSPRCPFPSLQSYVEQDSGIILCGSNHSLGFQLSEVLVNYDKIMWEHS